MFFSAVVTSWFQTISAWTPDTSYFQMQWIAISTCLAHAQEQCMTTILFITTSSFLWMSNFWPCNVIPLTWNCQVFHRERSMSTFNSLCSQKCAWEFGSHWKKVKSSAYKDHRLGESSHGIKYCLHSPASATKRWKSAPQLSCLQPILPINWCTWLAWPVLDVVTVQLWM